MGGVERLWQQHSTNSLPPKNKLLLFDAGVKGQTKAPDARRHAHSDTGDERCGRMASHQGGVELLVQDRFVLDESDALSEATRGDGLLQTQLKVC